MRAPTPPSHTHTPPPPSTTTTTSKHTDRLLANLYNGNVYIWNYNDSVRLRQSGWLLLTMTMVADADAAEGPPPLDGNAEHSGAEQRRAEQRGAAQHRPNTTQHNAQTRATHALQPTNQTNKHRQTITLTTNNATDNNQNGMHQQQQTLAKSFEVTDLPVRAAKFVARRQWVVAGADDMMIRVYNYNTMDKVIRTGRGARVFCASYVRVFLCSCV